MPQLATLQTQPQGHLGLHAGHSSWWARSQPERAAACTQQGCLLWCSLLLQAVKHALLRSLVRRHDLDSAWSDGCCWQHPARSVQAPGRVITAALPWHRMQNCADQAVAANTAGAPEGGLCLHLWKTSLSGRAMPTGRVSSSDSVHPCMAQRRNLASPNLCSMTISKCHTVQNLCKDCLQGATSTGSQADLLTSTFCLFSLACSSQCFKRIKHTPESCRPAHRSTCKALAWSTMRSTISSAARCSVPLSCSRAWPACDVPGASCRQALGVC